MLQRGMLVLVFLTACARGSEQDTIQPEPLTVDAAVRDAEREPVLSVDPACYPQASTVCNYYYVCNPVPDYGRLTQYSLNCKDTSIISFDRCLIFSFDPRYYSLDTWAYCCIGADAGAIK